MNGILILIIIALVLALVAGRGEIARLHKQLGEMEAAAGRVLDAAAELQLEVTRLSRELDRAVIALDNCQEREYDLLVGEADEYGFPY